MAGPRPSRRTPRKKITGKAAEKGISLSDAQVRAAVLDCDTRRLMNYPGLPYPGTWSPSWTRWGMRKEEPHPELDPRSYGFTEADMDCPIFLDNVLGMEGGQPEPDTPDILKRTYCGTFALQFMHIFRPRTVGWLKERIEGLGKEIAFTKPRPPPRF